MWTAVRVGIAIVAVLLVILGLGVTMLGGAQVLTGLWMLLIGGAALIALAFERTRYQSEAAERAGDAPGQAGVDVGPPDARFRPTEERFVDPTTHRRLRVWLDPASGERRYRLDE